MCVLWFIKMLAIHHVLLLLRRPPRPNDIDERQSLSKKLIFWYNMGSRTTSTSSSWSSCGGSLKIQTNQGRQRDGGKYCYMWREREEAQETEEEGGGISVRRVECNSVMYPGGELWFNYVVLIHSEWSLGLLKDLFAKQGKRDGWLAVRWGYGNSGHRFRETQCVYNVISRANLSIYSGKLKWVSKTLWVCFKFRDEADATFLLDGGRSSSVPLVAAAATWSIRIRDEGTDGRTC